MDVKELKRMAAWGVKKWIDERLPKDDDYNRPEIVSDKCGQDYVLTLVFHDNSNGPEEKHDENQSRI